MSEQLVNNRRIMKNTIFLYIRMFITIVIGLYVSRVVLRTLGEEDYGIYNVVGGVIVLLSFLSQALSRATQRFISYELGKKDFERVKAVFNVSIECHLVIALIILFLAETIGLWFINAKLNIPLERMSAANWVYQISILTFLIQIMHVPYNAMIISYEKMSFYAYVSILEALLKLGVAYLLVVSPIDKLITYASLLTVVAIIVLIFYVFYCCHKLHVKVFTYTKDLKTFKELMSFSGLSMLAGGSTLAVQQGGNFIINIFLGVVINAACGVATQVTGMVYSFVSNFQYAFQPQITKLFAANEKDNLYKLIYRSSSISYYLMLLIFIPFVIETNYVLELWLGKGQVPEYASIFCQLMLAYFLCDAIQAPLWMLINATGNIKGYTIWSSSLALLNLPLAWLTLKYGYPVYWVFIIKFVINFIGSVIRTFYVNCVTKFSGWKYIEKVVIRASFVSLFAFGLSYLLKHQHYFAIHPIVEIVLSFIITLIIIICIGFNKSDRLMVIKLALSKLHIFK